MSDPATYSELDSRRFGKRIYRANISHADDLSDIDDTARRDNVDLVVARCPVQEIDTAQSALRRGYELMDTLVCYRGLTAPFASLDPDAEVRLGTEADEQPLMKIASECFTNYQGHYHADRRLDPALATLGYVEWCVSSLRKPDHIMWIIEREGLVAGFLAYRRDRSAAEITLNGVALRFRERGLYDRLFKAAARHMAETNVGEVIVSTQLGNMSPQRAWTRNGLTIRSAVHTFHKWFIR